MPLPIYCLKNTFKITFNIAFKIASKNVLKIAWDHLWHLVAGALACVGKHVATVHGKQLVSTSYLKKI